MQSQFTTCQCGCGSQIPFFTKQGLRSRFSHGHNRRRPLADRFWEKVNKDGPIPANRPDLGPCWLFTRSLGRDGYGKIAIQGRHHKAHRVSYEWEYGPIPEGLEPDHLCRVHACVRPSHLEAVTHRENTLRGIAPAAVHARKTHCPQGHAYDHENTSRYHGGRRCRRCHREQESARWRALKHSLP